MIVFKRVYFPILAGVMTFATMSPTLAALPAFDSQGQILPTLAPMLDKVTPAIVNIATRGHVQARDNPLLLDPFFRRFFGIPDQPREKATQSLGSGVVVDAKQGYILTNNHVIDKADEITVTLRDGRNVSATLVGADREADVAVIQIPAEKLTAIPLADSSKLRVGDFVVAIGNPFGLGQTVTSGIVSALGRSGLGIEGYEDFIQTDASINPGNSGGALVTLAGELVGINTAILAPNGGNVGIGFAIPINMATSIMKQLVAYGEVRRGKLGVAAQDLTEDLARAFGLESKQGAVVSRLVAGSPAARAGVAVGDVVTEIQGHAVNNAADLRNTIGLLRVGETVDLAIYREGKRRTITVKLEETKQAKMKAESIDPRLAGAVLQDQDGAAEGDAPGGVLVAEVAENSPAWSAGLRPNDALVSINRHNITQVRDLKTLANRSGRLLLHVRRGDAGFFLLLE